MITTIDSSILSDGERLILGSAEKRNGIFHDQLGEIQQARNDRGVVLTDGTALYPLGSPKFLAFPAIEPYTEVLGTRRAVNLLLSSANLPAHVQVFEKDFAVLLSASQLPSSPLPEGMEAQPVATADDARSLSRLKAAFLAEEAKKPVAEGADESPVIPQTQSILLKRFGEAIGMVNSNFFTEDAAMVNMLYIAPPYRGGGNGTLLLQWYVRYLLQHSASVCLFYSPTNTPAKRLYESMGFDKREEWMMLLK